MGVYVCMHACVYACVWACTRRMAALQIKWGWDPVKVYIITLYTLPVIIYMLYLSPGPPKNLLYFVRLTFQHLTRSVPFINAALDWSGPLRRAKASAFRAFGFRSSKRLWGATNYCTLTCVCSITLQECKPVRTTPGWTMCLCPNASGVLLSIYMSASNIHSINNWMT